MTDPQRNGKSADDSLEELSREELVELVRELQKTVAELEVKVNYRHEGQLTDARELLFGEDGYIEHESDEQKIRDLPIVDRILALEDRLEEVEQRAEQALGVAQTNARDGGDDLTKKRVALLKSRNELIRRAAVDESSSAGSGVTVSDVQDMALPEVQLYRQTVADAWTELVANWGCFDTGSGEDGVTRLKVEKTNIPPELVGVVEHDLDRDDLRARLGVGR